MENRTRKSRYYALIPREYISGLISTVNLAASEFEETLKIAELPEVIEYLRMRLKELADQKEALLCSTDVFITEHVTEYTPEPAEEYKDSARKDVW